MQWKWDKQGREREKRRKERKRDTAIYWGLNVKWRHRFALREGDEVLNIFKISSLSSDAHIYSLRPSFSSSLYSPSRPNFLFFFSIFHFFHHHGLLNFFFTPSMSSDSHHHPCLPNLHHHRLILHPQ